MTKQLKNYDFSYSIITFQHNAAFDIDIYSIGCELSHYDANKICEIVNKSYSNAIIISTCAVVESAKEISLNLARKLKFLYPNKKLIITGCAINYSKSEFEKYGICLDNAKKFDKNSYVLTKTGTREFCHSNNLNCGNFVKIQDGCSAHCGYCIIPKIKNNPHSESYSEIYADISEVIREGKTSISLIGTEVAMYKSDGMNLVQLIKKITYDFPQLTHISFNAIDPTQKDVVLGLIDLMKTEKRLDKFLVLSPQSCCDEVLKMMQRKNTFAQLDEIMEHAHSSNVNVIWHIIIGYPGESDELFMKTYNGIKKLNPFDVSFHPYSEREGTYSSTLTNKVSADVIANRIEKCKSLLYELHDKQKSDYKGQFDEVKVLLDDNSFNMTTLDEDEKLKQLESCNDIYIDFNNVKDYHELELNTKVVLTLNTCINLQLVCKIDNKFIQYCIDNNIRNFEELGYIYSSNVILQHLHNIQQLSHTNMMYLLNMINNRRKNANNCNLQDFILDYINCN